MPLDPETADILARVERAGHPAFWQMTAPEAREAYRKAARILEIAPIPMARIDEFAIRARAGHSIATRLYVPRPPAGAAMPLIVYFHGGGFTIGDLDTHDAICRMLASRVDSLVLAVDYRLAPENPFPAAVDDAIDAMNWARASALRLGADPSRVAVAGDSAGGTLATVCAIDSAARAAPLAAQALIYPGCAGYQDSESHRRLAHGYLLDAPTIQWFFGNYLARSSDRDDWRFGPLTGKGRPDLSGVAPTLVLVAEFDPLHDEGVEYAALLRAHGVSVELQDCLGMVHGFFNFGRALAGARAAHELVVAFLRRALAVGEGP